MKCGPMMHIKSKCIDDKDNANYMYTHYVVAKSMFNITLMLCGEV